MAGSVSIAGSVGAEGASIGFGLTAFAFMTVIPVSLALFAAVPNPH